MSTKEPIDLTEDYQEAGLGPLFLEVDGSARVSVAEAAPAGDTTAFHKLYSGREFFEYSGGEKVFVRKDTVGSVRATVTEVR